MLHSTSIKTRAISCGEGAICRVDLQRPTLVDFDKPDIVSTSSKSGRLGAPLAFAAAAPRQHPQKANGADIAVSPKHTCIASERFWAIACPGFASAGLAFSLRGLRCLPWLVRWLVRAGFLRPVTLPVSGPVRRWFRSPRQAGLAFSITWRFRDRFDALSFRSSCPLRRSSAFRKSFPTAVKTGLTDLAPLTASAVRQIRSEDFLRRVFRRC